MLSLFRDGRALALLLAASLTILSNTLISPALPGIEAMFSDQPNAGLLTRLLVTAPSLLVALCAPFAGALVDRFGRRRLLLSGVLLFAIAGSAGLWLPSLLMILGSRLVLGVAVAMVMTAQTALIGDYFSGAVRGQFMGLQIAVTNFAGVLFFSAAGWLTSLSAQLPFAIYLVALLYLPAMWKLLPEPDRTIRHAHVSGGAGHHGWRVTLGMVIALTGVTFVSFYFVPTQLPYYLGHIGYPEPVSTAILLGVVTFAGGVASLVFGRIRPRLGRAGTAALGFASMAAGFALLALAHGMGLAIVAAALIGSAIGFVMPTVLTTALDVVPAARRGLASGAITTSIFLGQFLSPLVSQPLIGALGYAGSFALLAALLGIISVTAYFGFRERAAPVI